MKSSNRVATPGPFQQESETARLLSSFDWETTELGPVADWPTELRATVDLLLDSGTAMMLGWGPELRVIYNDAYTPMLAEKHPALWHPAVDLFPEVWDLAGPLLEEVLHTGRSVHAENMLLPLFRGGVLEESFFTFSYSPLRSRDGEVIGLFSTAVETTGQVLAVRRERVLAGLAASSAPETSANELILRASAVLSESEDVAFHVILERVDGNVFVPVASDGARFASRETTPRWLRESDGSEPLRRQNLDQLSGIRLSEGVKEGCTEAVVIRLDRISGRDNGESNGVLVLGLRVGLRWDDAYRSFIQRAAASITDQLNALRLRGLLLAEAEDRYLRLFHEAFDGIVIGDLRAGIAAANPAACRILGHSEDRLKAAGWKLVRSDDDERWDDALITLSTDGEFHGPLDFVHRSERIVNCEVSCREIRQGADQGRQTVILRDVSERLLLEEQLAEAQRTEVVARLAGGIAHDFNNLLTVIGCQSSLLADRFEPGSDLRDEIGVLEQAARRGASLIRRLQSYAGQYQGEKEVFSPLEAVSGMAEILRRLVDSSTELCLDLDEAVPMLEMAPHQFEQILMNLVVNARDAVAETGTAGRIDVRLRRSRGDAIVIVEDDGVGMSAEVREQVFDPFFTTKDRGTGIGLNSVKLIVEQNQGDLAVRSRPGVGTTFEVRLPGAQETAQPAAKVVDPTDSPLRLDGLNVLLVEDQAHVRAVLTALLERAGATVVEATNGEEAVRLVRAGPPDVMVCDVVMPLLTGPAVVRELRPTHPDLAVVMISGYVGDEALPSHSADRVVFLSKPFTGGALAQAIHESLQQHTSKDPR